MAVFVKMLPAAALLVAAATSLGAQETKAPAAAAAAAAPACDAAQPSSSNGARANISLQMALKDQKANPGIRREEPAGGRQAHGERQEHERGSRLRARQCARRSG